MLLNRLELAGEVEEGSRRSHSSSGMLYVQNLSLNKEVFNNLKCFSLCIISCLESEVVLRFN